MGLRKYWFLCTILLFGTALRLYPNLDMPLWHDEAFSALMVKYSWSEMMSRIRLDVHPPMYYIFLKLWNGVFGNSQLSVRGFSILFSTLTVWAGWLLTREAFKNDKVALGVALLSATNLFQLRFTTEARMYSMGMFFSLLSAYYLIRALSLQNELYEQKRYEYKNMRKAILFNYIAFTVSTIIILYTHYYLLFTASALGIYGLLYLFSHYKWDYKKYYYYVASWIVVTVAFLVWINTFIFQYRQVSAAFWPPKLNILSYPTIFWDLLLGTWHDTHNLIVVAGLIFLTAFSIYFFVGFLRKTDNIHKWLIALVTVAPFAGSLFFNVLNYLKGNNTSILYNRYFLFASVFFLIALSVWIHSLKRVQNTKYVFLAYVIFNLCTFAYYWQKIDISHRQGIAAAAKYLDNNIAAGEKLYVTEPLIYFSFKYYNSSPVNALFYSHGENDIRKIPFNDGAAILTNQELLPSLEYSAVPGDVVWLLWQYGPKSPEVPRNWSLIGMHVFTQCDPELTSSSDVQNILVKKYKVIGQKS